MTLESLLRPWDKSHHEKGNYSLSSSSTVVAHKDCEECTSSPWDCHWCAHDNACHIFGSMYGCVSGVNCYSDNRC